MSTLTTLGILDIIYWPFGMLMKGIYSLVGNYGIAIIIFGIIVKLILLPFAFSNEKTRLRNMRIQPKMREIQQRYKGDTRNPKYQEEMQKLYLKHLPNQQQRQYQQYKVHNHLLSLNLYHQQQNTFFDQLLLLQYHLFEFVRLLMQILQYHLQQ